MPASEKQLAANRANASKSTGPRTAAGKASWSMNAVTHGLTAQAAALPGEDATELEALSAALMQQLNPTGMLQRVVAERIVSLAWKLRRVARAEESVGLDMLREDRERARTSYCRTGAEYLAHSVRDISQRGFGERIDNRLTLLTYYELKLDGALRAAVRELRQLKKDERDRPADVPVDAEFVAPAAGQNEANSPDDGEIAPDKKNPIPEAAPEAQPSAATGLAAESSSPAR